MGDLNQNLLRKQKKDQKRKNCLKAKGTTTYKGLAKRTVGCTYLKPLARLNLLLLKACFSSFLGPPIEINQSQYFQ